MSLAVERYRGSSPPAVYEVLGERLVVRRTVAGHERRQAPEPGRLLAFAPPRHGWRPEDAVYAYRASLAGEAHGPSIDLYA